MHIETAGCIILGMNKNGADTDNIGSLKRPQQGILQQACTELLSLPIHTYGQPRQNHDRHRMTGQPFCKTFRSVFIEHLSDRQTVETDDGLTGERNVTA